MKNIFLDKLYTKCGGETISIPSEVFMNLHKKYAAKLISFLVINIIFASDSPLSFRHNLLEM